MTACRFTNPKAWFPAWRGAVALVLAASGGWAAASPEASGVIVATTRVESAFFRWPGGGGILAGERLSLHAASDPEASVRAAVLLVAQTDVRPGPARERTARRDQGKPDSASPEVARSLENRAHRAVEELNRAVARMEKESEGAISSPPQPPRAGPPRAIIHDPRPSPARN